MTGTAGMLGAHRNRRFGMLFSIVAGLLVSLTVAPARAADLALPTDEKILEALKAKRLTRCPHAGGRLRCGGARLRNPPLKGRVATSTSRSMTAAPLFRLRAISFAACFGDPVLPAEQVRVAAAWQTTGRLAPVTRRDSELWQGVSGDRTRLAYALPPLFDTCDELRAVAAKLGVSVPPGEGYSRTPSNNSAWSERWR
jgi:hypothetical protein